MNNVFVKIFFFYECKTSKQKIDLLPVWNFFNGSTIAKNLSADKAVSVNTDTPMDMSLAVSEILQINDPQGQDSNV